MFPLGAVLLPEQPLTLHVFEPRYRALVRDVERGGGEFGVVLIERGSEVGGGDTRFDVGTTARLVQVRPLPDGRSLLAAIGASRFVVRAWFPEMPYPRALVEPWPDLVAHVDPDAVRELRRSFERVVAAAGGTFDGPTLDAALSPDPRRCTFELAAASPLGPLDRQHVLAERDPATRVALLRRLFEEQADVLERG